jgi:uncharacterized protein (TIGR03085 family)
MTTILRSAYHRGVSYAREERAALCALLDATGPDAPTLCEGWRTKDLAAHLVLRERRPDAAAGLVAAPLAGHTQRVHQALASRVPFGDLVEQIRTGPPALSFYRLPGMDDRTNTVEFFVHHEDVRRAADGWQPRDIDSGLTETLWQRLRLARFIMRRVPVGVELVRDDVPAAPGRRRVRIMVSAKTPVVTVTGHPSELTLWVLGRRTAAAVRVDGGDEDMRKLERARWRV